MRVVAPQHRRWTSRNFFLQPTRMSTYARPTRRVCCRSLLGERPPPRFGAEQISAEILKREELGSTVTGGGVALPHARIQGLSKEFGVLARLNKPWSD